MQGVIRPTHRRDSCDRCREWSQIRRIAVHFLISDTECLHLERRVPGPPAGSLVFLADHSSPVRGGFVAQPQTLGRA